MKPCIKWPSVHLSDCPPICMRACVLACARAEVKLVLGRCLGRNQHLLTLTLRIWCVCVLAHVGSSPESAREPPSTSTSWTSRSDGWRAEPQYHRETWDPGSFAHLHGLAVLDRNIPFLYFASLGGEELPNVPAVMPQGVEQRIHAVSCIIVMAQCKTPGNCVMFTITAKRVVPIAYGMRVLRCLVPWCSGSHRVAPRRIILNATHHITRRTSQRASSNAMAMSDCVLRAKTKRTNTDSKRLRALRSRLRGSQAGGSSPRSCSSPMRAPRRAASSSRWPRTRSALPR